eukprot:1157035-Pelagomonas_calceolata.AAC.6
MPQSPASRFFKSKQAQRIASPMQGQLLAPEHSFLVHSQDTTLLKNTAMSGTELVKSRRFYLLLALLHPVFLLLLRLVFPAGHDTGTETKEGDGEACKGRGSYERDGKELRLGLAREGEAQLKGRVYICTQKELMKLTLQGGAQEAI